MNHFYKSLSKKKQEFIDELFDSEVIVTEKIDGTTFVAEWVDNNWKFYKGRNAKEINNLSRLISGEYEPLILFFQNIYFTITDQLPNNIRFEFEYVDYYQPNLIAYHREPKNKIVLHTVYIDKVRVDDINLIQSYISLLNLSSLPLVFQGKLSTEQKDKLLKFLSTDETVLQKKFRKERFTRYIYNILNPELEKSYLQNELSSPIEGLVFSFKGKDKPFVAKIVDPTFTEEIIDKKKNPANGWNKEMRATDKFLFDIFEYMIMNGINKFILKYDTIKKINIVSYMFLNFKYGENLCLNKDIYNELPDYLKKQPSMLNERLAPTELANILSEYPNLHAAFINFIMTLNSDSKKVLERFPSLTFIKQQMDDLLLEYDYPKFEVGEKTTNVMMGKFQPFSNGHLKVAEKMYEQNGLPTFLIVVRRERPLLSNKLTIKILDTLVKKEKLISGYVFIDSPLIGKGIQKMRDLNFEPILIGCGEDRKTFYEKQFDFITKNKEIRYSSLFHIQREAEDISASKLRKAIFIDDQEYTDLSFPKYLHKYVEEIQNELNMDEQQG